MSALKIAGITLTAALTASALTACGNENKAQPIPTQSTTPSTTTADIKASAEAFVREYQRVYDEVQRTGQYERLESDYYDPSCVPCKDDIKVLAEDRRRGQHVEGYEGVLLATNATATPFGALVAIKGYKKAGRMVRNSDGEPVEKLNATDPVRSTLTLRRVNDRWLIVDITLHGA